MTTRGKEAAVASAVAIGLLSAAGIRWAASLLLSCWGIDEDATEALSQCRPWADAGTVALYALGATSLLGIGGGGLAGTMLVLSSRGSARPSTSMRVMLASVAFTLVSFGALAASLELAPGSALVAAAEGALGAGALVALAGAVGVLIGRGAPPAASDPSNVGTRA